MSDDIKETSLSELLFNRNERLIDYIINLQEENKHLDKVNSHLRKKINNDIYKLRNEKAIQYTKNHTIDYVRNGIECCKPDEYFNPYHLIDILEGESNDSD